MTEKRTLTCHLSPKELEERGAELARTVKDWDATEEEKKSSAKLFGDRIKEHEGNMKRLGRIVSSGKEEREVEIEWRPYPSSETMRQFRMDTGEEISSRPMTKEEREAFRQEPLFKAPTPPALAPQLPAGYIAPTPPPQVRQLPGATFIAPQPETQLLQLEAKTDIIEGEFEELTPP